MTKQEKFEKQFNSIMTEIWNQVCDLDEIFDLNPNADKQKELDKIVKRLGEIMEMKCSKSTDFTAINTDDSIT